MARSPWTGGPAAMVEVEEQGEGEEWRRGEGAARFRDSSFILCEHDRNRQIVDGRLGAIGPDRASQIEPITISDFFSFFSFKISL